MLLTTAEAEGEDRFKAILLVVLIVLCLSFDFCAVSNLKDLNFIFIIYVFIFLVKFGLGGHLFGK